MVTELLFHLYLQLSHSSSYIPVFRRKHAHWQACHPLCPSSRSHYQHGWYCPLWSCSPYLYCTNEWNRFVIWSNHNSQVSEEPSLVGQAWPILLHCIHEWVTSGLPRMARNMSFVIWASSRQNLSSGFPTKQVSNHSSQLQRLAKKLKFHL